MDGGSANPQCPAWLSGGPIDPWGQPFPETALKSLSIAGVPAALLKVASRQMTGPDPHTSQPE